MEEAELRACQCPDCLPTEPHENQELHRRVILFFSQLREPERRWFAALEASKVGHGGELLISQITGLDPKTIRRGGRELDEELQNRPAPGCLREPGGGRHRVEKKAAGD